MALWKRDDTNANSAPKFKVLATSNASCIDAFGNVTVGAFVQGQAVGVFGVDAAEAKASKMIAHPGWVKITQGTGPVNGLAVANGGSGYANTDLVRVSGGTSNAAGSITTNSTGGIVSVTLTSGGQGFKTVATSTAAVTNSSGGASAGSGGVISLTLGGRAGRKTAETLVAFGTITGDAADDSVLPDA